jgi:hypothetical protein
MKQLNREKRLWPCLQARMDAKAIGSGSDGVSFPHERGLWMGVTDIPLALRRNLFYNG